VLPEKYVRVFASDKRLILELSYTGQRGWYQKQHVKWKDNNMKKENLLNVKK
jgi:hypothetical protein